MWVTKNQAFERSLSKVICVLLSYETPLQVQIFFIQSVNKIKLTCSLVLITELRERAVLPWVFRGSRTILDFFPSRHPRKKLNLGLGGICFPSVQLLGMWFSLLTFLNIIESRAWLSIKTFETMNSVGVHSGKRGVREHLANAWSWVGCWDVCPTCFHYGLCTGRLHVVWLISIGTKKEDWEIKIGKLAAFLND